MPTSINNPATLTPPYVANTAIFFVHGEAQKGQTVTVTLTPSSSGSPTVYTFTGNKGLFVYETGKYALKVPNISDFESISVQFTNSSGNAYQVLQLPNQSLGMVQSVQVQSLASEDTVTNSDYDYNDAQLFVCYLG